MRVEVEYQLLNERQYLRDTLRYVLKQHVVNLNLYRRVYARFQVCDKMLNYYRINARKAI